MAETASCSPKSRPMHTVGTNFPVTLVVRCRHVTVFAHGMYMGQWVLTPGHTLLHVILPSDWLRWEMMPKKTLEASC